MEEIHSYNLANMVTPWPTNKVNQSIDGIWKKHIKENGAPKHMKNEVNNSVTKFTCFLGLFFS